LPEIHPTAIVEDSVQLADDVVVGPHCVLRGQVRVGSGCRLIGNVYLQGPLTMGSGNVVYPFACLGFEPQDLKYDASKPGPGVVIGDRNTFREGSTVHRATGERPTTIGSDNLFMAQAHVGHDGQVANRCVMANASVVGGHSSLADNVIIGGFGGVHQFCRVGRLAMISGLVAVVKDLPPFCVAYTLRRVGSLNLVGLRRAGYRQSIPHLKAAFDILYRQQHSNSAAARIIQDQLGHDPLCAELAQFVAATKRGISVLMASRKRGEGDEDEG
jgi:UDP-N-acetylglucosamine acyltransferase